MANGKRIKPAEYKKIKDLIALGLTNKQVREICNVSDVTVWHINKSVDFKSFRNREEKPKKQMSLEDRIKVLEAKVAWLESEARKQPKMTVSPEVSGIRSWWFHS